MTRLQSTSKLMYYPTPENLVPTIATWFHLPPSGPSRFLDPEYAAFRQVVILAFKRQEYIHSANDLLENLSARMLDPDSLEILHPCVMPMTLPPIANTITIIARHHSTEAMRQTVLLQFEYYFPPEPKPPPQGIIDILMPPPTLGAQNKRMIKL